MKITASVEYALQALTEIAAHERAANAPLSAHEIARVQAIPNKFLESLLRRLTTAGVLVSSRGPQGGYRLARAAHEITVAEIIRTLEGPLAAVGDRAPEAARYRKNAKHVTDVWIATRVALREVLEKITLEDIVDGAFDSEIKQLLRRKDAWVRRA